MTEMEMPAELEYVTDIAEIGSCGLFGTPAVVVDVKVKSVEKNTSKDGVRDWMQKEQRCF